MAKAVRQKLPLTLSCSLLILVPQIVQRHYQRIINNWPVDLLRPDVSLQKALQYRIDTKLKPSRSLLQNNVIANEAQATVPTPVPFDEKSELEQVNVLYSFLENRYTKKVRTHLGTMTRVYEQC